MTINLETTLIAAACITAGCGIGLLCRIRTDYQLWRSRRRNLQHRKLSFRRPHHRGDVLPDLILVSAVVALALAIFHYLATR